MSRPRNLSDSGNKSLDCFSYKDKEGNAETTKVMFTAAVLTPGQTDKGPTPYERHMLFCEWTLPQGQ